MKYKTRYWHWSDAYIKRKTYKYSNMHAICSLCTFQWAYFSPCRSIERTINNSIWMVLLLLLLLLLLSCCCWMCYPIGWDIPPMSDSQIVNNICRTESEIDRHFCDRSINWFLFHILTTYMLHALHPCISDKYIPTRITNTNLFLFFCALRKFVKLVCEERAKKSDSTWTISVIELIELFIPLRIYNRIWYYRGKPKDLFV